MKKNVLILCTGNSCRSIIAEALVNSHIQGVTAYSAGVKPCGKVHPNAKKVLEEHHEWQKTYHSKTLDTLAKIHFDLVVTVCNNAHESCPIFPFDSNIIHLNFEDPDGKAYSVFERTYQNIKEKLLPKIIQELNAHS